MALIGSKNTKPERIVRSMLHCAGFRFRLHRKDLPGTPDIVLPRYMTVIFVNGCFWHSHQGCRDGKIPKKNKDYWQHKLERNVIRDKNNITSLQNAGWKTLIIWECEIKNNLDYVLQKIVSLTKP